MGAADGSQGSRASLRRRLGTSSPAFVTAAEWWHQVIDVCTDAISARDRVQPATPRPSPSHQVAQRGPSTPLQIGARPAGAVTYRANARSWLLWWPCDTCGGVVVPLCCDSSIGRVSGSARDGVRVSVAPGSSDLPCPSCETRRRRRTAAGAEPAVWYDTWLEDWVVQLPCDGLVGGALLPLEIHWFDANWADVYRTAADVCYCDDAIVDV
jgi:hypothetical protein